MGFLSGVLGAVKNENEVTTYDNKDGNDINKLISDLNSKIGYGRHGLVKSVEQVKEWLDGYEREVKERTENVENDFSWLLQNLNGNYKNKINENSSLTEQLSTRSEVIGHIDFDVTQIEEDKISKLDIALKTNVMNEIKVVKKSVEMLKQSAINSYLKDQARQVEESLVRQKESLHDAIMLESEVIQKALDDEFRKVFIQIGDFKDSKYRNIWQIKNAVKHAKKDLLQLNDRYKNEIVVNLTNIKGKLDIVDPAMRHVGGDGNTKSKLRLDVEKAKNQLDSINSNLQHNVHKLGWWAEKTKKFIDKVKHDVEKIINREPGKEIKNEITTAAQQIDVEAKVIHANFGELKKKYDSFYEIIKGEDGGNIGKTGGTLGKLKDILAKQRTSVEKADLTRFKSDNGGWNLRTQISGLTGTITTNLQGHFKSALPPQIRQAVEERTNKIVEENGNRTSLGEIVKGVKQYAGEFGTNIFEEKLLKKWIDAIVEKDPVNEWLRYYVNANSTLGGPGKDLKSVKKAIQHSLPSVMREAIKTTFEASGIKTSDPSNIAANFKTFADRIETDLTKKDLNEAITAIETTLGKPSANNKHYLDYALKTMLPAIAAMAREFAEELHSFLEKAKIGNLRLAIEEIKQLGNTLSTELTPQAVPGVGNLGSQVQSALARAAIAGEFDNKLRDLIRAAINSEITKLHAALKVPVMDALSGMNSDISSFVVGANHAKKQLETHAVAVKSKVTELLNEISTVITDNIRAPLNLLTEDCIDDKLATVRDTFETIRFTDVNSVTASTSAVVKLIEELEKVPESITDTIGETVQLMGGLASQICDKLNGICQQVELADNALTLAISAVHDALIFARQILTESIITLKTTLLTAVTDAFRNVTDEVRTLFAEGHKADLAALKTLVDGQKQEIEKIIEHDKKNGVKGLIKWMNGGHYSVAKPLKTAANDTFTPFVEFVAMLKTLPTSGNDYRDKFSKLGEKFEDYLDTILEYIKYQLTTPGSPKQPTDHSERVKDIKTVLDNLLGYLKNNDTKIHNFDRIYVSYLTALDDSLNKLTPTFSPSPLLAPLKAGLSGFTQQLGHAYVSRYSGMRFEGDLVIKSTTQKPADAPKQPTTPDYDLTPEGRNCAKVCLTIVEMVSKDFEKLRKACYHTNGAWRSDSICLTTGNDKEENPLGTWLKGRGYKVSNDKDTQNGELDRKKTGKDIIGRMINNGQYKDIGTTIYAGEKITTGSLETLRYHLRTYYKVRHLQHIDGAKAPCSINQMLQWCAGLQHNLMFDKVCAYFMELFEKPDKYKNTPYASIPSKELNLYAYPEPITYGSLKPLLNSVCAQSHSVLTAIQGHGHADGVYACDYYTNESQLFYPGSPSECFDTLVDIMNKMYHQLYFLFTQCERSYGAVSWRECYYGRDIGGSDWRCNTKQCVYQSCEQKRDQIGNQLHEQMGDQHPKCGLKSPLQSFLEDGLQGFLPHTLTKVGCGVECSLGKHRGVPCKTPMGFADLGTLASHTQKGDHIMQVISKLCGNMDRPLSILCSVFICLLQRPPQTLDEMFAFYYQFLYKWNDSDEHKKEAFDKAVTKSYFNKPYDELQLNSIFSNNHSSDTSSGDMLCLISCKNSSLPAVNCGRYLEPMGLNVWSVYSKKNASKYLSWIVYLSETFYNLLDQLYKECCNNCTNTGTRCDDKGCPDTCPVKKAYASEEPSKELKNKQHIVNCRSIAQCRFTRPTLCRYGFVFKSLSNLSGINGLERKRTCRDLCNALEKVLSNKISDDAPLAKLVHDVIPKFIWAIRLPFFWLNVALWLLSLFYLLHIMVIRLDLLHIKSHLHSPSSHRIAAQSLLAAARVNKLNRVFYLQP